GGEGRRHIGLYSLVGITTHLNPRMRGLESSEAHPRYAVSHDPHCRCPGLSIIARFIAAPWTTKRDHWRERERQIKRLSLATLARRCRAEFGRRFPRPRRWLAVDFLGGSGDYRARCSPGNLRGGTPREAEGCESQARLWRRYLRLQHRFGLPSTASASDHVWA